jgi:hypothetical protein
MAWYMGLIVVAGIVGAFFLHLDVRAAMSKLGGIWQGKTKDGADIIIQFDGEPKGGLYRHVVVNGDLRIREFGHWTTHFLTGLRLVMMATDVKDHPRFGVDTQYVLAWLGKDRIVINGPDRSKWELERTVSLDAATFQEEFEV